MSVFSSTEIEESAFENCKNASIEKKSIMQQLNPKQQPIKTKRKAYVIPRKNLNSIKLI